MVVVNFKKPEEQLPPPSRDTHGYYYNFYISVLYITDHFKFIERYIPYRIFCTIHTINLIIQF